MAVGFLRRGLAVLAASGGSSPAGPGVPDVGLDSLLRLPPSSAPAPQARTGGATRQEWEQRFAAARGDVEAAKQALEKAQNELGEMATSSGAWQMSAPGAAANANTENSPVSYRLRQEIRRQRDELASAERRLTELEVEANLAGVPEDWTKPPSASTTPVKPQAK